MSKFAKLSELRVGDQVDLDGGFDCMSGRKVVYGDAKGLYLLCKDGRHYLDGQTDKDGDVIGITKVEVC